MVLSHLSSVNIFIKYSLQITILLLITSKLHKDDITNGLLAIIIITLKSSPSEQLNTTHCLARPLAKSFVVSVFPVPAGPAGAPPKSSCNAPIRHK